MGAAVLTAAAVMFAGLFAPFVTQGCIFCALDYTIPSRSLVQSLDAWILVSVVVALAVVTISCLRNPPTHRRTRQPRARGDGARTRYLPVG